MERKPITAILKDVIVMGRSLIGTIHADTTNRFPDGTTVRTSPIVAQHKDVIITRNSVYYVANWSQSKEQSIPTVE